MPRLVSCIAMEGVTRKDPFVVMTAAVVHTPEGKPMFREIGYSFNPYFKLKQGAERVGAWRFQTPYLFSRLTDEQKDKEQEARINVHGLKYEAPMTERRESRKQFEVCWVVKKAWQEHCLEGKKKRVVVVYAQKEVEELLKLLEIPCMEMKALCSGAEFDKYSPYRKDLTEVAKQKTCGLTHDYNCPCQATVAMRWALFIYEALKQAAENTKNLSYAEVVGAEEKQDD